MTYSSEDEDVEYGYRVAPKRKRKFKSAGDDTTSSDDDEDDQEEDEGDEAMFDEDFVPLGLGMSGSGRGKNRKKKQRGRRGDTATNGGGGRDGSGGSAPAFVKGTTLQAEEEEVQKQQQQEEGKPTEEASVEAQQKQEEQEEEDPELAAQRRQLQEERERANERFLELLNRGRIKDVRRQRGREPSSSVTGLGTAPSQSRRAPAHEEASYDSGPPSSGGAAAAAGGGGLGLGAAVPSGFGQQHQRWQQQRQQKQQQQKSNIGTWEKHTKGIGMKLLAKMGYTGSGGLGKDKDGIAKPVPVKVRPQQLGLGFGNFKEVTSETKEDKVRKQRKEEEQQQRQAGIGEKMSKQSPDLLPSVRELLEDESWRRGAKRSSTAASSSSKRNKRTVVPYTELLKRQKQQSSYTIIDMRGPGASSATSGLADLVVEGGDERDKIDAVVPLAEELLHNVSLLLNTYENKVYSSSSFASSTEKRLASLKSDVANIKEQSSDGETRIKKLQTVLQLFDDLDSLCACSKNDAGVPVASIQSILLKLKSTFSDEERVVLKFNEVIIPSLVGAFVQPKLDRWNPFKDSLGRSEQFVRSVLSLGISPLGKVEKRDGSQAIVRSLLADYLLPRVKASFESFSWDPVKDCDSAIEFYELFLRLVQEADLAIFSEGNREVRDEQQVLPSEPDDTVPKLTHTVKDAIINRSVYNRLSRAISQWQPQLDEKNSLVDRLDLWVLPWIPYLDQHQGLVPSIVADCKRKVRSSMSYLQKIVRDDDEFVVASSKVIMPWKGVFKERSLQDIVSTNVTPRLARSLRKNFSGQDLDSFPEGSAALNLTLAMAGSGLLSKRECLSLVEGEVLAGWVKVVHSMLTSSSAALPVVVESFERMKKSLISSPRAYNGEAATESTRTRQLIGNDEIVCRYFYSVLLMMRAAADSNASALTDLQPALETNYRVVLARRTAEEKTRSADELLRMEAGGTSDPGLVEARVRLSRRSTGSGQMPTFRDVVAEFAREREFLFQPRLGNNSTKDGKQVFLFGKTPIYFDSNVVFALCGPTWQPVTLDELAQRS